MYKPASAWPPSAHHLVVSKSCTWQSSSCWTIARTCMCCQRVPSPSCVVYQTWKCITRPGHLSCGIYSPYNFTSGTSANLDFMSPSHCRSTSSTCRWTGKCFTIASNGFANNAKFWLRVRAVPVNNLFGFASPFANHYQPAANQCNIWFAETANQHVGQGTGLEVRCWQASWQIVSLSAITAVPILITGTLSPAELPSPEKWPRQTAIIHL